MSREIRKDPVAGKRMTTAALIFAAAMLGVGGSIAWVLATASGGQAGGAQSLSVCFFVWVVLAATVNVYVAYGRLMWFYKCPRCTSRAERVSESDVDRRILYRCPQCNIDWDTGWKARYYGGEQRHYSMDRRRRQR